VTTSKKKKEEAEIWKEHFDKLLNTEEPKELIKTGTKGTSEVEVEEITIEDVEWAISNLRNNKAAGTDGIHSELHNKIWRKQNDE
jgi:hypothetical protein